MVYCDQWVPVDTDLIHPETHTDMAILPVDAELKCSPSPLTAHYRRPQTIDSSGTA